MTDYSRDRLGPDDDDRLPWLEPVEEELEEGGIITGRLIVWLAVALLAVAVIVGGFFWFRSHHASASGEGALIKAPDSYYKERPAAETAATGGDEIVYSASKGNEVASAIDTSSTAETPVNVDRQPAAAPVPAPAASKVAPPPAAKPVVAPAPAAPKPVEKAAEKAIEKPAAKPKPVAAKPETPKPAKAEAKPEAAALASGGTTVQLGAFSSEAKANAAWKNLSGRFSFLAGLTQSVVPVQSGDKTLYRLRASGGNAGNLCGRLRTAGETCSVIG